MSNLLVIKEFLNKKKKSTRSSSSSSSKSSSKTTSSKNYSSGGYSSIETTELSEKHNDKEKYHEFIDNLVSTIKTECGDWLNDVVATYDESSREPIKLAIKERTQKLEENYKKQVMESHELANNANMDLVIQKISHMGMELEEVTHVKFGDIFVKVSDIIDDDIEPYNVIYYEDFISENFLENAKKDYENTKSDINDLNIQLNTLKSQIREADKEHKKAEDKLNKYLSRIQKLELLQRIASEKGKHSRSNALHKRIKKMYNSPLLSSLQNQVNQCNQKLTFLTNKASKLDEKIQNKEKQLEYLEKIFNLSKKITKEQMLALEKINDANKKLYKDINEIYELLELTRDYPHLSNQKWLDFISKQNSASVDTRAKVQMIFLKETTKYIKSGGTIFPDSIPKNFNTPEKKIISDFACHFIKKQKITKPSNKR